MPPIPPPPQLPRGPSSALHKASYLGVSEQTLNALLSSGSIDINTGGEKGLTPLMFAAVGGHPHSTRVLLDKGASVSVVDVDGCTALLLAAQQGHLAVTKMLVEAGAELEAATSTIGNTPLHFAADGGHTEVMQVLIEAGANPNCRKHDGSTPLFTAASRGSMETIRVLLRAGANPQMAAKCPTGDTFVPLDAAAAQGYTKVVRMMIEQFGIQGCGGQTGGIGTLCVAAGKEDIDTMTAIMDAGVIDTGAALAAAAECSCEASVKFLLQKEQQQRGRKTGTNVEGEYVNKLDDYERTPLLFAMGCFGLCFPSPRIVRMLVDAGANTTSVIRVTGEEGSVIFLITPQELANRSLREKRVKHENGTREKQLHKLEAIRRMLLQVEAAHAVSWLWPSGDVPSISPAVESLSNTKAAPAPVVSMVPILKRRAGRHGVLVAALSRWVVMSC